MKRLGLCFGLCAFLIPAETSAQETPEMLSWKHLSDVRYNRRLNKDVELYFMYPVFGPSVKALDGKQVSIRGYMIPVDASGRIYVVSAKPMAQCFFCGGAGPESLIELHFRKKGQRFRTDEIRVVRGRLKLNGQDIEHLNYILENAEVVP